MDGRGKKGAMFQFFVVWNSVTRARSMVDMTG